MKTRIKTVILVLIVLSCTKEFYNPYDRDCPPEIWTPANLTASATTEGVSLKWEQNHTHFSGFLVERSLDSINWTPVNNSLIDKSLRNYIDSEKLPGGKVYYRISAKADKNQSNFSYSKALCLPPPVPGTISGNITVPENAKDNSYTILSVAGATGYLWSVPPGDTIVSGQGTNTIKVNFGISSGEISVQSQNHCGLSVKSSLMVTVCQLPATPGPISGKTTVVENALGEVYSITPVSGAITYLWKVPDGITILSGQGTTKITVNFGNTGGDICVRSENSCGNSNFTCLSILTCKLPAVPGPISGKQTVVENATGEVYSISPVSGATSYNWKVPDGTTILSGQGTTKITVNFGNTGGDICVRSENSCGNSNFTCMSILTCKLPAVPGPISGKQTVVENATGEVYSISPVNGANSYNWKVPDGTTILSGQGTTKITINFGNTGGDICVRSENSCGNSNFNCLSILTCKLPAVPGPISGKQTVVENATGEVYSVSPVRGATSYNWKVPDGTTILSGQGTTKITVNFGNTGGDICVRSENSCGNSNFNCLSILTCKLPAVPWPISGKQTVVENATGEVYSISPVNGATSYNWKVPDGTTILSGQGTTKITVNFDNTGGDICVRSENSCGNSNFTCLSILTCKLPAVPGPVSGKQTVVENATGEVYSISPVNGATSYNWKVPDGTTILSGQGTTKITVNFGASGGDIFVRTENICGVSSYINLTINMSATCIYDTFIDTRDGRQYNTIQIGSQLWLAENLAWLPYVSPSSSSSSTLPFYYVYSYSGSDVSVARNMSYYSTYGVLYNWQASLTACPSGWHLPNDAEWAILLTYLGGENVAGGKMKETGSTYWPSPNRDATNESCFSGLPAGYLSAWSDFSAIGDATYWWSSSEETSEYSWYRALDYPHSKVNHEYYNKNGAFSVRCIKN
jgi:uncharacterized protein (TIGR02145 family)